MQGNFKIVQYLLLMFLFTVIKSSQAQTIFGFELGLDNNSIVTNTPIEPSTKLISGNSYMLGANIIIPFYKRLSLKFSPNISGKGYSYNRTDSLLGVFNYFNNTYLQLPIGIYLHFGKRIHPFFEAGMYLGYWISGNSKGKVPNIFSASSPTPTSSTGYSLSSYEQSYHFNNLIDNRLEIGYVGGMGVQYSTEKNRLLSVGLRYYYSLTNQYLKQKVKHNTKFNEGFILWFGGSFPIKL